MEETWKQEYRKWKDLNPAQLKLLEEGPQSLSQSWLINSMWCEWKDIKKVKDTILPNIKKSLPISKDPWDD